MIPPTLQIEDAACRAWDAVVLGAGPAGSMAALLLARNGVRVLLIDRRTFPREKVCGGCLNGRALAILDQAGLTTAVKVVGGCRLNHFHLATGNRHARLALPEGLAVSRSAFDAMLLARAIEAGASFLDSTVGRIGRADACYRPVHANRRGKQQTILTRVIISATGLATERNPEAGFAYHEAPSTRVGAWTSTHRYPAYYRAGTIFMAASFDGYVGLTRVEGGRLNIAAALERSSIREIGVAPTCERILQSAGFPYCTSMLSGDWLGTGGLTRSRVHCAGQRLFAVGDSVGYVEPFTGEGMYWALESGSLVVPFIERGIRRWTADLALQWDQQWRRTLANRQRTCRVLSRLIRHPNVFRQVVQLLQVCPVLAWPVIRSLSK